MQGTGFKLDTSELEDLFKDLLAKIANPKPALRDIGEALVSSTVERLYDGVTPEGKKQTPVKNRPGETPLLDSTDYSRGFKYAVGKDWVVVGTNKPQARLLHKGGVLEPKVIKSKVGKDGKRKPLAFTIGGKKVFAHSVKIPAVTIPARPHIGISEDDKEEIAYLIRLYLSGAAK
ncbi:MAG: phage virion morphogenesis protein [Deferribacterales bacterium]